jgi:hypothetical protein
MCSNFHASDFARGDTPSHFAGQLCGATSTNSRPLTQQAWRSKRASISPHIERVFTRRSFEQWLRAKLSFIGKEGTPRDIAMKLNAALGLLHRHMA